MTSDTFTLLDPVTEPPYDDGMASLTSYRQGLGWAENGDTDLPPASERNPVDWTMRHWRDDLGYALNPYAAMDVYKEWVSRVLRYKRHLHGRLPDEGTVVPGTDLCVGQLVRATEDNTYPGWEGYLTGAVAVGGSVAIRVTNDHTSWDRPESYLTPGPNLDRLLLVQRYHPGAGFWFVSPTGLVGLESSPEQTVARVVPDEVADLRAQLEQVRADYTHDLAVLGRLAVARADGQHWEDDSRWCSDYEGFVAVARRQVRGLLDETWDRKVDGNVYWEEQYTVTVTRRRGYEAPSADPDRSDLREFVDNVEAIEGQIRTTLLNGLPGGDDVDVQVAYSDADEIRFEVE